MKILHSFLRAISCSAVVLGFSTAAHAALYGNFAGPNITYENVIENDSEITGPPVVTSTPAQLFGAPDLSPPASDILTFPDISFSSKAADGTFDLQDGQLTLNIIPTSPSGTIDSLLFDEGGAWRVVGPVGDATAEATLLFSNLEITSVNNLPLVTPIIVPPSFSEYVTPQDGPPPSPPPGNGPGDVILNSNNGDSDGTWDITASFNLDAALAGADMAGDRVTEVSVALDDQLFTQTTGVTGALTLAQIDKKHFVISGTTTTTTPVPEPASLSMLLCAGLILRPPRRALRAKLAKPLSRKNGTPQTWAFKSEPAAAWR